MSSIVPVIAIITKFDIFVQDILQNIEEIAEVKHQEINDDELEQQALAEAKFQFNKHYSTPLLKLPYPPKAVVALSETHNSTPNDSRLANLIHQTMKALEDQDGPDDIHLSVLFASAQMADIQAKLSISVT